MAAITLADVNKTLVGVEQNTSSTEKGINKFLKYLEGQRLKDLETQRESGKVARAAGAASQKQAAAGGGSGFKMPGMAGLAGLGSMAGLVASGLIRRGLPSLLLYSFADEIVDHFFPNESELNDAQKEMKNMLEGAIQGGALGFLLGRRFAVIGTVIGALSKNKTVRNEFGKLVDNLDELGINMELLTGFATTMANTIGSGLEGFNKLFSDGEFDFSLLDDMLLTVGSLALILSPKRTIGLGTTLAGRLIKFNGAMLKSAPKLKGKGRLAFLAAVGTALGLGYMSFGADEAGVDADMGNIGEDFTVPGSSGEYDAMTAANTALTGYAMSDVGKGAVGQMEADKFARQQKSMDINQRMRVPKGQPGGGQVKKHWFEKYPRLAKMGSAAKGAMRGLGILNAFFALMAAAEVQAIANDPNLSDEQKAEMIGAIVGENLGAVGLSAIGGVIGTIVGGPVGLAVGAGIGGVAGAFGGRYAGGQLMRLLMGKSIELDPFQKAARQSNLNVVASGQALQRLAGLGITTDIRDPNAVDELLRQIDASGLTGEAREQAINDAIVGSQLGLAKAHRAQLMSGSMNAYVGKYDQAQMRNMAPQQYNIDQSVTGSSNTTLSAPPPSAAQNDDYSGAVHSRMNLSTSGYLN